MFDSLDGHDPNAFEIPLPNGEIIVDESGDKEGRDVIRRVKTRAGQKAFAQYEGRPIALSDRELPSSDYLKTHRKAVV